MVRRQVGHRVRQHDRRRRDRRRARSATARSVRSGRSICRPTPRACAPVCANSGRTCSAKTRANSAKLNRTMDAALKGHPYVKSGIDIACWDILGQAAGLPVCELLGGRYGEDVHLYRAISQESPEQMAAKVAGYRAEGYRALPTQGRRRSGRGHRAHPRRRREAPARRPARRRRQHRLGAARSRARGQGRARRGRLHRAAVPDLRGVPRRAPADAAPVRARREHRRPRHAAARQGRPRDGRGEPEDQQARRPDEDQAGPRPVREHGHRDDARR